MSSNQPATDMTKLKEALQEKIREYEACIGHPRYNSRIEQNAAETVLRVLKYLDSIAEYEEVELPDLPDLGTSLESWERASGHSGTSGSDPG